MNIASKPWVPRLAVAAALIIAVGGGGWWYLRPTGPGDGFVQGNGRIEAVEVDVATKSGGRLQDVLVNDGDFVTQGQALAHMDIRSLSAQRAEAVAQLAQAKAAVDTDRHQVAQRESERAAAQAMVAAQSTALNASKNRLRRTEELARQGAVSAQALDDARAEVDSAKASLMSARAQLSATAAAIKTAQSQQTGAASAVDAVAATIARIDAEITDSTLVAPRSGRVQFRIAQPGEVLGAGGKVLSLVDLSDVYMTFFLPETVAGRVALGSEARIVLDVAPEYVIPARISFVASTAQFTPKTVETASERQKLMFRIKAQISRELLIRYLKQVKTGVPGVAWVKLDPKAPWPAELAINVPKSP